MRTYIYRPYCIYSGQFLLLLLEHQDIFSSFSPNDGNLEQALTGMESQPFHDISTELDPELCLSKKSFAKIGPRLVTNPQPIEQSKTLWLKIFNVILSKIISSNICLTKVFFFYEGVLKCIFVYHYLRADRI